MSSNIRVEKTCNLCGTKFIARKTTTSYCSDTCSKRAYKNKLRDSKIQSVIQIENKKETIKKEVVISAIKEKEFLSIAEVCVLIGASRWTIYRLIENGKLKVAEIGRRKIIRLVDIDSLFK